MPDDAKLVSMCFRHPETGMHFCMNVLPELSLDDLWVSVAHSLIELEPRFQALRGECVELGIPIEEPLRLVPLTHNPQNTLTYASASGELRIFLRTELSDPPFPLIVRAGVDFKLIQPSDGLPNVLIRDHAVNHHGRPVSHSLPRRKGGTPDTLAGRAVLRHSDGNYSTLDGKPIVRNRREAANEEARSGLTRNY